MKKRLVLLGAITALLLASGCSTAPSDGSTTGTPSTSGPLASTAPAPTQESMPPTDSAQPPAPSASEDSPPAAAASNPPPASADGCQPAGNGLPTSVKDFDCLNLTSVSGTDANGEIAWLGTDPFTLVTMLRDGNVAFSSKTPCNSIMSSVEVTDTQFIVDPNMAMTMMACQSPQSDYETWVSTFFSTPLNYTLNTDSLVLSNDHGTVTFKVPAS